MLIWMITLVHGHSMVQFFLENAKKHNKKQKHTTHHNILTFPPLSSSALLIIVRFPRCIAFHTHIQILQTVVVITNINDLRIGDLFCICLARAIRASECVDARESGVQFGVFIDNVIIYLFSTLELGIHYTDFFLRKRIVAKSTRTAVIRQFIAVLGIDLNIEHIGAFRTELHCIVFGQIVYSLFLSLCFPFSFYINFLVFPFGEKGYSCHFLFVFFIKLILSGDKYYWKEVKYNSII